MRSTVVTIFIAAILAAAWGSYLTGSDVAAARAGCAEDDPCFVWAVDGNLERGVVLKNGRRALVDASEFCRAERAKTIDWRRTPRLRGDYLARTKGCNGKYFAQPAI